MRPQWAILVTGVLLLLSSQEADSLTPSERCEACQIVLKTVYGHFFKQVSSRRKLAHQLRHECNRHYQYRRRCLLFTRTNTLEIIFHEMGATEFKPINPCTVLKECKSLHSPIIETSEERTNGMDETTTSFNDNTSTSTDETITVVE
ncbi:unnamed protein product, partial [Mesorhabditis belari]|uniref:Saposin B-type domain-containing protein n=1 Tax=Mesorhabditis belari TaxID=2138241 RepID=A0AAF3EYX1_9BILA